jgi:hypothetical protein
MVVRERIFSDKVGQTGESLDGIDVSQGENLLRPRRRPGESLDRIDGSQGANRLRPGWRL